MFTQLSKHAPTMVADSRAKMNKFVTGVSDLVVNECRSIMLIPNMKISHLMVYFEQIEEQKLKQIGRQLKNIRTEDGNFSKTRIEFQDKRRFKKWFFNQGPYYSRRLNKSTVSTPNTQ